MSVPKGEGYWLPKDIYRQRWLCVWEMPDGTNVGNSDGEFLCAESFDKQDPIVEKKMAMAARSYGIVGGRPSWRAGRKVSAMEADDQAARLLEGLVPDERDETLIALEEAYLKKKHGVE